MFNTTRIFAVFVLSTFCSAVSAFDAAANSSVQSSVSAEASRGAKYSGAKPSRAKYSRAKYFTAFSSTQKPISEGGRFITSTTPGVNWSGLRLGGCGYLPVAPVAITAPVWLDLPISAAKLEMHWPWLLELGDLIKQ